MSNSQRSKSVNFLLISVLAMSLPLGVLWYRSLPLSPINADTAGKLWVQVFKQQRVRIEKELGQRDSKLIRQSASTARWNFLQRTVIEQGATPKEAQIVVDAARSFRPTISGGVAAPHWPILIQKGFVRNKRVWVSICAADAGPPYSPSNLIGWSYWVRVINADKPDEFHGIFSANQAFPLSNAP